MRLSELDLERDASSDGAAGAFVYSCVAANHFDAEELARKLGAGVEIAVRSPPKPCQSVFVYHAGVFPSFPGKCRDSGHVILVMLDRGQFLFLPIRFHGS